MNWASVQQDYGTKIYSYWTEVLHAAKESALGAAMMLLKPDTSTTVVISTSN